MIRSFGAKLCRRLSAETGRTRSPQFFVPPPSELRGFGIRPVSAVSFSEVFLELLFVLRDPQDLATRMGPIQLGTTGER